jgi:hypothetical protein
MLQEPLEALAAELGSITGTLERELRLSTAALLMEVQKELATLRAGQAAFELRVERAVAERLAALKDGDAGPQGERGERGEPGKAIEGPPGEQGIQGPPGPPGEVPYVGEVCGTWQPDRAYRKYDLVAADGGEWRARYDDPGPLPGEGWALSAVQGRRGNIGQRGERGPPGPAAPAAAVQTGWEITGYVAVPVMSDGSLGPPLDIRPLFERYDSERA